VGNTVDGDTAKRRLKNQRSGMSMGVDFADRVEDKTSLTLPGRIRPELDHKRLPSIRLRTKIGNGEQSARQAESKENQSSTEVSNTRRG